MNGISFLTRDQWHALVAEHHSRCFYCGEQYSVLWQDHLIPRARGGDDSLDNIVPACRRCNILKRDRTAEEFFAYLEERGLGPLFRALRDSPAIPAADGVSYRKPKPRRINPVEYEGNGGMTTAQVAAALECTTSHVRVLAKTGRLAQKHIGGAGRLFLYDAADVARLVAEKGARRRLPKRPKV